MRSGTIAFSLGVLALYALAGPLPEGWTVAPFVLVWPLAFVFAPRGWRPAIAFGGLACAGFVWALFDADARIERRLPEAHAGTDIVLTGRVASLPAAAPRRVRFDFVADEGPGPGWPRKFRLSWYDARDGTPPPELVPGERWRLVVRAWPPRGFVNPGSFDYETWLYERGYAGRGHVRARDARVERLAPAPWFHPGRIRFELRERLRAMPGLGQVASLVEALTVGARDRIGDGQREVLRRTGTSHLLAISGLHIGLAAAFGFLLARLAGPWIAPRTVAPVRLGIAVAIAVAVVYAALAGFSLPTRRALVMTVVLLIALSARRRMPVSAAFCLGLAAVLVPEPPAVLAPGFWLSFGAVAVLLLGMAGRARGAVPEQGGMLAAAGDGPKWRVPPLPRRAAWLHWRSWALPQVVVTLGLAPLIIHWFGEQPVAGPLANAVAIPWVGVAVLPALLAGVLLLLLPGRGADVVGEFLVTLGARALEWLWWGLELLATHGPEYVLSVEPSFVTTGLAFVGVLILLAPPALPGRWTGVLWFAPLLWWSPVAPAVGEARFAVLDVGHGLAAVVETRRHTLVYDTGPAWGADIVRDYLAWRGRRRIDALVVSHADSDHSGGRAELMRRLPPVRVLANEGAPGAEPCFAGERWEWDGVGFEVLHPPPGARGWRGNDGSCVVRVTVAGGRSLLLAGDVEERAERWLTARAPEALRAEVVVVPHHGSRTSSTAEFVAAVGARHALFSTRHANYWNLPHPEVLARYRAGGAEAHRTDLHGALLSTLAPDGVAAFRHWRPRHFWHAR